MNKFMLVVTRMSSLLRQGERGVGSVSGDPSGLNLTERVAAVLESFLQLLRHVSFKGFVITGMLLVVIVMSAIGVVYSSHLSRQLFAEQAILLEKNDQLQLEWAQLLLEQSAWSSPSRIESVARDQLNMEVPETEEIKLIY